MAILVKDGKVLMSDGKILTAQDNGNSIVNLTKKIPVPNNFGASEFFFDTSKSIDEVVEILSQLSYNYIGNYVVCEHATGGWYSLDIYNENSEYYRIQFVSDDDEFYLFDSIDGWFSDYIIDGKFDIPTHFKGGGYHNGYGLQNNLLIDLIWCEQPIYVPQKEVIAENDLEVDVNFYQNSYDNETYYPTYEFWFKGDYLQNKNVVLNLPNYIQEGDDLTKLEFNIYTNVARNCKMTIILPENFYSISLSNMGMYNTVCDVQFYRSSLEQIYQEGTHHQFWTDNNFLFYNHKDWVDYFIVIEWDADGFATINMLQDYEF